MATRFPDGGWMSSHRGDLATTHEDEAWGIKTTTDKPLRAGTTDITLDAGYTAGNQNAAQLVDVATALGAFNVYVAGSGT